MWERKYKKGRWNGIEINVLNTAIDGGKRLHVTELAYADLPNIQVMGTKAKTFSIEVVFVGAQSLVEANKLLDSLNATPKGTLEHPWLGELSLTFESYSQSIGTTRGVVTLSLSFVRSGFSASLSSPVVNATSLSNDGDEVLSAAVEGFPSDVANMSINELNTMRDRLDNACTTLGTIATRLNVSTDTRNQLNSSINQLSNAIAGVSNDPRSFALELSSVIDDVAEAVNVESMIMDTSNTTEVVNAHQQVASKTQRTSARIASSSSLTVREVSDTSDAILDHSRMAQSQMLTLISSSSSPENYLNVQFVVAAMKMNRTLQWLEKQERFDVTASSLRHEAVIADLKALEDAIEGCIREVTLRNDMVSYQVYDALTSLKQGIGIQTRKVENGIKPVRIAPCERPQTTLNIAHAANVDLALVEVLSESLHPLFVTGDVTVEVMS